MNRDEKTREDKARKENEKPNRKSGAPELPEGHPDREALNPAPSTPGHDPFPETGGNPPQGQR